MTSGARLEALSPSPLDAVPPALTGGFVAIGNFDGMHRGHVALLEETRREASAAGAPAVVLTFEPHPRTVFRPETPVFRLTPLPAKARLLKALGFDGLVVATFDRVFSSLGPSEFVTDVLVRRVGVKAVVVGYNFHFGKARAGTPAMLADVGPRHGFIVTVIPEVLGEGGHKVSSSAIRDSLAAGNVAGANRDLGYRWFVTGTVVSGDRRGRELGYPTANIVLGDDCRLRHGIYAVTLQRPGGARLSGVASYGRRPTFGGGAPLLEVHAFDFWGDLYGEEVAVVFHDWIRAEQTFESAEALIEAMDADSARARGILADRDPDSALDVALQRLP